MDEINSLPTSGRQNEKLLTLLSRKSAEQFQIFLRHLDAAAQGHIRNAIDSGHGIKLKCSTGAVSS